MRTRRPLPPPTLPGLGDSETRTFQPPVKGEPEAPRPRRPTPVPDVPAQPDTAWPALTPSAAVQLAPAPDGMQKARDAVLAVLADGEWHPFDECWKAGAGLYHLVTAWGQSKVAPWQVAVDSRADGFARVALWDSKAARERRGLPT